jgi:uncharacterized repeat protein (TIGR03803 family)
MTPDGIVTVLHAFMGRDGASPSGLIQATDGNFYGTTAYGGVIRCPQGSQGCGTVFQVTPDGTVTIVHAFTGGADGQGPAGAVIEATDGNFYGTTLFGGRGCPPYGCGTIFRITPDGMHTVLADSWGIGDLPRAGVTQASNGNLYGTTSGTDVVDSGTVFQVTLDGVASILYTIPRFSIASHPNEELLQGNDGALYGASCCVNGKGVVFRVTCSFP